jgi:hypothetical protein
MSANEDYLPENPTRPATREARCAAAIAEMRRVVDEAVSPQPSANQNASCCLCGGRFDLHRIEGTMGWLCGRHRHEQDVMEMEEEKGS